MKSFAFLLNLLTITSTVFASKISYTTFSQGPSFDTYHGLMFDIVTTGYAFDAQGNIDWSATDLKVNVAAVERLATIELKEGQTRRILTTDDLLEVISQHTGLTIQGESLVLVDEDKPLINPAETWIYPFNNLTIYKEIINGYYNRLAVYLTVAWPQKTSTKLVRVSDQIVDWVNDISTPTKCGGSTYVIHDQAGKIKLDSKNILTVGVSTFTIDSSKDCSNDINLYDLRDQITDGLRDWQQRDVVGRCITLSDDQKWRANVRVMNSTF